MGQVRLNLERFNAHRGSKTWATFANELGIDAGTVSRVTAGKSLPSNPFIAAVLTHFPEKFDYFFTIED
jgi:hypothetical protein